MDFEVKEKGSLTLGAYTGANGQVLVFDTPKGSFSVRGPEVADTFWQIWFGVPDDGGLERLKTQLVAQTKPKP